MPWNVKRLGGGVDTPLILCFLRDQNGKSSAACHNLEDSDG